MSRATENDVAQADQEMLPEYDFTGGVRGKYAARFRASGKTVVLSPDVAEAYPTDEDVNNALRLLLRLARTQVPKPE